MTRRHFTIKKPRRAGKVIVLLLISLPAMLGIIGLVFDAGMMASSKHDLQHAADAAASAGAMDLRLGKSAATARQTVETYLANNHFPDAAIVVNIPPASGSYAGRAGYVEVIATQAHRNFFINYLNPTAADQVTSRAVAGAEPATAGAAIVVLDPDPAGIEVIAGLGLALPNLPALLGGLEVLGVGPVRVDGAVLVNNTWGGMDENGDPTGDTAGPPSAVHCTPLLPLTRLRARDIRVVGGVDDRRNYQNFAAGGASPLQAGRIPVPDPFAALPTPCQQTDAGNVSLASKGGVRVVALPILSPPVVLSPGVYDWIEVLTGVVRFEPGIYIIRGKNPLTQISLNIAGGVVRADGVMFYLTDSSGFNATTGAPDFNDGEARPPMPQVINSVPSVVIAAVLPGSSFTPLNDVGSPFHDMLLYQRRQDFRPVVIAQQNLIGSANFDGTIYAKWSHVIFAGDGDHELRIVAGTLRLLPVLGLTIAPRNLLPPAVDVYVVE